MSLENFQLPDDLDLTASKQLLIIAGSNAAFIAGYEREARISLHYLKRVFSKYKNHATRETAVRQFLQARNAIAGNYSFFAYPNSPINQICLQLMQEIVKPNEPLIKIMVPTLDTRLPYIEDDLITFTETTDADGKRTLKTHTVLMSDDGKGVIPIAQWFAYQEEYRKHSDEPYHHLYSSDAKLIHLNKNEIERLRYCVMPFSDKFFDDADLRKRLLTSIGTLAEAVSQLCDELFENGKAKKGTAEKAHDDIFDCIRQFSSILDKLDVSVKEKVFSQKAGAKHFGFYWNIISAYNGSMRKQYTEADRETCIWDNGNYLKNILKANIEFFSSINIAQNKNEASSSSNTTVEKPSQNLLKNIEEELEKRKKGEHPQDAIYFYEQHDMTSISNLLNEYEVYLNNDCMVIPVQRYESALFYQILLDEAVFIATLKKIPNNILSQILTTAIDKKNERLIAAIINADYDFPKYFFTDQNAWASLLLTAVENNWINVCKAIVKKPEVKLANTKAIHKAAQHGLTEIVEIIGNKTKMFDIKEEYGNNYTPLQYAALHGHLDTVKLLVLKGARINVEYMTLQLQPVFLAAVSGHFAVAWFLIEMGARISLGSNLQTLMHLAAEFGDMDFAKKLRTMNIGLHGLDRNKRTPIYFAVLNRHLHMVNFFIKCGVNVNAKYNNNDPSLLLLAATHNDTDITKTLVKAGAHINVASDLGETSLHKSAMNGNLEVTQLLVEHHADMYVISATGYTPLDLAFKYNHIEVAEFLMSKMDFEVLAEMIPHRNKEYFINNALYMAAAKAPPRILALLLKKGQSPAAVNELNETAFHRAASANNLDGLVYLIQNTANKPGDYEIKDSRGYTPITYAIKNGFPLCVEALLRAGAQLPEKIDNTPLSDFIHRMIVRNTNSTAWIRLKTIIENKESASVSYGALVLSCKTSRDDVQISDEEDLVQISSAERTPSLSN